jgi:hypothetical protein
MHGQQNIKLRKLFCGTSKIGLWNFQNWFVALPKLLCGTPKIGLWHFQNYFVALPKLLCGTSKTQEMEKKLLIKLNKKSNNFQ